MSISEYFEAKKRLYPQAAKGHFRKLKNILNTVFLTIYLLSPFLRYDRGENAPDQAILIDFPNSKAYFFFIEIWPNEVYYLAGILIIAAITLFFITSLFGRVWCGYACFQTVWTDIFIAIERLFQGNRNERIILDRKNTFEKFYKKGLTHLSFIIVSIVTGFAFTNYFNDSYQQISNLFNNKLSLNVVGWTLGIGFATYIMAGFAREHVCTYMCPYSRFQSAMFDKNTLIISYDEKRGEPRGKYKQGDSFEGRGDCIDCKQCVVVCPAGIDIRNGLQMECIACGLCIDACNDIMEKINRPKNLIRYDTQSHLDSRLDESKFKIFSNRFFFYSVILTCVTSIMLFSLINKSSFEATMLANRNPAYITLSDGSIRNGYELKLINKTHNAQKIFLRISNFQDAEIKIINYENDDKILSINPESNKSFKLFITIPKEALININEDRIMLKISLFDNNQEKLTDVNAVFIWDKAISQ